MGKRREGDSGRNDFRRDSTAMAGASAPAAGVQGSSAVKVIRLGKIEGRIQLALIEEFARTQRPVGYQRRDEIVALYAKTAGAVMLALLRKKGAVISDASSSVKDVDCIPVTKDVVYVDSRNGTRLWPSLAEDEAPVTCPAFSGPEPARIAGAEADNLVLAPSTTPVVLSPAEARVYALLLESRPGPMSSAMIIRTILDQVQPKSPHSLMFRLEHVHECLRLVGGKAMSRVDPAMRQVVHRPYCVRGSQVVVVPTMCSLHPEAVSPQVPALVVAAPAPSTIRLRTRGELQSALNELDSRIDERLAALKLARLADLDLSLIGLRVREDEAKGALRFIGEQLEETKRLIAELNDPAVDDRKKFEVPKMLLDLLARAGLLRSAIEKYAIVEEVAGVLFETN